MTCCGHTKQATCRPHKQQHVLGSGGCPVYRVWTPNEVYDDLYAWYDVGDASTVTLNGSTIAALADKGPNGLDVSQGTVGRQPEYDTSGIIGTAGRAVAYAPSRGKLLQYSGAPALQQPCNVFYVGRPESTIAVGAKLKAMRFSNDAIVCEMKNWGNDGEGAGAQWAQDGYDCRTRANYPDDTDYVMAHEFPDTAAIQTQSLIRLNGTEGDMLTNRVGTANGTTNLELMAATGANDGWQGAIGEWIIYGAASDSSLVEVFEGYLAWHHGTEGNLDAGHPYKSGRPVVDNRTGEIYPEGSAPQPATAVTYLGDSVRYNSDRVIYTT